MANTTTASCPYCESQRTQFIKNEGLDGCLKRLRCDTCQKEWAERLSTPAGSKQRQLIDTREPSLTAVATRVDSVGAIETLRSCTEELQTLSSRLETARQQELAAHDELLTRLRRGKRV